MRTEGSVSHLGFLVASLESCSTLPPMSAQPQLPRPAPGPNAAQQLVLLGAASAHLRMLAELAAHRLPQTQVTLVAAQPHTIAGTWVPGFVAGHTRLENCSIALKPLAERSGVRWMPLGVVRLDATKKTVHLSDGSNLGYDWLSIAHGPTCNRDNVERALPGAREHALFVHPVEPFAALWPRVATLGDQRPLRIAVLGHDAQAFQIAMAVRHRLPHAAVTLLCGAALPVADFPPPVRHQLLDVLKNRHVTVLQERALAIHSDTVALGCGASLACDVVLLADRATSPAWLAHSDLALDANNDLLTDASLRSTSHGQVFGIRTTKEAPSGLEALLVRNVRAAMVGKPMRSAIARSTPVQLLSCGDRSAIAAWGAYSAQGRGVWWLKNWLECRRMTRYLG